MSLCLKFCFLVFTITYITSKCSGSILVLEIGPKKLSSYEGIGDQVVFHWPAYNSSQYLLQFSGTVNQSGSGIGVKCANGNVTVLVRQNGIPVSNPRNSFWPNNTIVRNNGLLFYDFLVLSPQAEGQVFNVTVDATLANASSFFAALFLPYDLERFDVAGLTKECSYYMSMKVFAIDDSFVTSVKQVDEIPGMHLTRKQQSLLSIEYEPSDYIFNISSQRESKFYWEIYPVTDSGGTIDITIHAAKINAVSGYNNVSISGCLENEGFLHESRCREGVLHLNNSNLGARTTWHIPFPLLGVWSLSLMLQCDSVSSCSNLTQIVQMNVAVTACIDSCNAEMVHGSCGIYRSDAILFGACQCKVGWRGLACNDGRDALSYNTQLLHTLLLTLSNIMFIPCVILAISRKFYTESLVYFFVLFMSSFYHACDQPGQVVFCILPYETLQFSDFLSSINAIWFTLIAVAKLPLGIESFLQVLGLIALAVCVSYDRFNVWTTVVPAVVGVIVVTSKWGYTCHENKKCYPGRKKTLFSIIPGVICAAVGLSLYAFVETSENYYIVHSLWHIFMALAVLFLLPIKPRRKSKEEYKLVNSTASNASIFSIQADTNSRNDFL